MIKLYIDDNLVSPINIVLKKDQNNIRIAYIDVEIDVSVQYMSRVRIYHGIHVFTGRVLKIKYHYKEKTKTLIVYEEPGYKLYTKYFIKDYSSATGLDTVLNDISSVVGLEIEHDYTGNIVTQRWDTVDDFNEWNLSSTVIVSGKGVRFYNDLKIVDIDQTVDSDVTETPTDHEWYYYGCKYDRIDEGRVYVDSYDFVTLYVDRKSTERDYAEYSYFRSTKHPTNAKYVRVMIDKTGAEAVSGDEKYSGVYLNGVELLDNSTPTIDTTTPITVTLYDHGGVPDDDYEVYSHSFGLFNTSFKVEVWESRINVPDFITKVTITDGSTTLELTPENGVVSIDVTKFGNGVSVDITFEYDTGYTYTVTGFTLYRNKIYEVEVGNCLLYTSPSPRDLSTSRMPSSA